MQLKQYEVMQYVDHLTVDIQQVIKEHTTIKKWAYILHDKDDTGSHYHVYLNFGNSGVPHETVAKWFDVPPSFVSKIKGRATDMLLYLTHGQESQKHKHQYSPSEVVANFDFESDIKASKIIGNFKEYSYAQMIKYVDTLPVSEKRKAYRELKGLWELECSMATFNPDRQVDVVFVCGKAGLGKTYYAKKLLESQNLDYCISSSSNDPLQDYLGQRGIILDDLRDTVFELPDLLKLLDNDTSSTIKSRFANKVFNGCMIIITSSVPINYWYPLYRHNSNDGLDQLYRRIGVYVEVKEKEILVYNGLGKDGKPIGEPKRYYNEVYDLKQAPREKRDVIGLFDKMCKPVEILEMGNKEKVVLQQTFDVDDEVFG